MKSLRLRFAVIFTAVLTTVAATVASAQTPKYEGTDVILDAPASGGKHAVRFSNNGKVTVSGLSSAPTGCNGSTVSGSGPTWDVSINSSTLRFCFQTTGTPTLGWTEAGAGGISYSGLKWPADSNSTGFYNVKDFGAVGDNSTDDTGAIKNALIYVAAKTGGTLYFPTGRYKVTNTLTLPSGIVLQGASGRTTSSTFLGTSNFDNQTKIVLPACGGETCATPIFRIGEFEESIRLKDIELTTTDSSNYGVEAVGLENAAGGGPTQFVSFEDVVFNGFDKGLYVHNGSGSGCGTACDEWQFDHIKVDHCRFINNIGSGIYIDTWNTDWNIVSTLFDMAYLADAMYINRAGTLLLQNSFGGGGDYSSHIGGAFLNIKGIGILTSVNSASERCSYSINFSPTAGSLSTLFTLVGNVYGDPITLAKPMTLSSTGNRYGGRNVNASDSSVNIYSMGDRFCYDSSFTSPCGSGSGAIGFQGTGRVIYQTGQPKDGSVDQLNTIFGLPVQFASLNWTAVSALSSPTAGTTVWCSNCTVGACSTTGGGALAVYTGSAWACK